MGVQQWKSLKPRLGLAIWAGSVESEREEEEEEEGSVPAQVTTPELCPCPAGTARVYEWGCARQGELRMPNPGWSGARLGCSLCLTGTAKAGPSPLECVWHKPGWVRRQSWGTGASTSSAQPAVSHLLLFNLLTFSPLYWLFFSRISLFLVHLCHLCRTDFLGADLSL